MTSARRELTRAAFQERSDTWVLAALDDGCRDFRTLLQALPSVYPVAVADTIRRLGAAGRLPADVLAKLQNQIGMEADTHSPEKGVPALPIPHPLDYEWRFSCRASDVLLEIASDLALASDHVVMLGTPALLDRAITRRFGRATVFFGEDNLVSRHLDNRLAHTDLPFEILGCDGIKYTCDNAAVVIIDPPWYFDFIKPFLGVASALCRVGGHILVSLPPLGTRATAEMDRIQTIGFGARLGLELIRSDLGALPYEMPFFERNALTSCGIRGVPRNWRRGDLLIFKRSSPALPRAFQVAPKRNWTEVSLNGVRLKIRNDRPLLSERPEIQSVVEGNILPTVSRRDPRRRLADLWTSGNRIYACPRPDLLMRVAAHLANCQYSSPDIDFRQAHDVSKAKLDDLAGQLCEIVDIEITEMRRAGEIYEHTRVRQTSIGELGAARLASDILV